MTQQGRARACANIALAKYWGKSDETLNLPAVPSLSITLDALVTETVVTLDPGLFEDEVLFDGVVRSGDDATRAREMLGRIRERAGSAVCARVETVNHFPTASGLASSASGFAALAAAGASAYGVDAPLELLSAWARRSSASAARSLYGGFVELSAGLPGDDSLSARVVADAHHWDVCVVIALASLERKKTSSRDGMLETARTSPFYPAWLACAPGYFLEVREGVLARDLERVGEAMEASTFAMHASALAARPAVRYYAAATAVLLDCVESLRARGIAAYSTMDAGPHVKVLCMAGDALAVRDALVASGGAVDVRIARPGPGLTR
ncbi:MAG: diphosphomevalonate decarboxylase [Deltaproteobacteria bacterium]|nr:diphosphomevalonate decarboxylase [Deltaproteobacteria bacterium]